MSESHSHSADQHQVPIETLLQRLECSAEGLSDKVARQRLSTYGDNQLQARQSRPEIIKFLSQFKNFPPLLLMPGGGLAPLADQLEPGQANFYIAYALLGKEPRHCLVRRNSHFVLKWLTW